MKCDVKGVIPQVFIKEGKQMSVSLFAQQKYFTVMKNSKMFSVNDPLTRHTSVCDGLQHFLSLISSVIIYKDSKQCSYLLTILT